MARTTARAAVMQMIFEHMAGGEGGEETLQKYHDALEERHDLELEAMFLSAFDLARELR